jgi:glycerophosphoryl diester phosphodiesterase
MATIKPFILLAHRGFSSRAPENTIAAFRLAIESGYPHVELDVQLTSDVVPVVVHDGLVDRTTNGHGKVSELTLSEITVLDAGSWFSSKYAGEAVPTLQEVLKVFGPKSHLNVELKNDHPELPLKVHAALLSASLLTNESDISVVPGLTITSFYKDQLIRSLQLMPNVAHSWLVQMIDDDKLEIAKQIGIAQLCPKASNATEDSVNKAFAE